MTLILTTPPAAEPVSLATLKAHVKVDHGEEDALIATYLAAARARVEGFTRRRLITQVVEWRCNGFAACLRVPVAPVLAVQQISFVNAAGVSTVLDSGAYALVRSTEPPVIVPAYGAVWPVTRAMPDAVSISLQVGYGASDAAVPADLKVAVLMLAGHYHANREAVALGRSGEEMPEAVTALLLPHVVWV
jgi:uncharacterized phiE125 gp8 family phage protein